MFFVLFFIYDDSVNLDDFKLPKIDFNLRLPQDLGLKDDVIVVSSTGKNQEVLDDSENRGV